MANLATRLFFPLLVTEERRAQSHGCHCFLYAPLLTVQPGSCSVQQNTQSQLLSVKSAERGIYKLPHATYWWEAMSESHYNREENGGGYPFCVTLGRHWASARRANRVLCSNPIKSHMIISYTRPWNLWKGSSNMNNTMVKHQNQELQYLTNYSNLIRWRHSSGSEW